jgi:FkbM family methyltransferase
MYLCQPLEFSNGLARHGCARARSIDLTIRFRSTCAQRHFGNGSLSMVELRKLMLSVFTKLTEFLYLKRSANELEKSPLVKIIYRSLYQRFKPSGIVMVDVQGIRMYVDSQDTEVATSLIRWGLYAKSETVLFNELIKRRMVVIDIGANIGYFTLLAARLVGEEGKVFAFEPEPYNYSLLCKNVRANGCNNVIAIQKAVFTKSGKMRLFLEKRNLGGHSLSKASILNKAGSITVEVTSLDEFFQNRGFKIDVVKMDAEGSEMGILQGMTNLINENDNLKIITEFSPALLRGSGFSPMDFLNKLTECGFTLYEIGQRGEPINVNQPSAICSDGAKDLLCIKPKRSSSMSISTKATLQ